MWIVIVVLMMGQFEQYGCHLQKTFWNAFLWMKIFLFWFGFLKNMFPGVTSFILVMAWHWTGNKPLPVAVLRSLRHVPPLYVKSLVAGRSGWDLKNANFSLVLLIDTFRSSHDNALRWKPWDFTDDKSTLVQVMAWCRQATSHFLRQCWPRSL